MAQYKEIEGQCGTCKHADCFDFAPSPSGPEDGVHCTSQEQAKRLDELSDPEVNQYQNELAKHGYIDIWRLEALVEEDYRCPDWEPSERWLDKQIPPQLSGH